MLKLDVTKTIDPRSHWHKFRRRELYAIANLEGIRYTPGCPANDIIMMLNNNGVDTNKYVPQRMGALYGDNSRQAYHVKKELLKVPDHLVEKVEAALESEPVQVTASVESIDPRNLSFFEKKTFCKEHGITINKRDNNNILRDKIEIFLNGKNLA